MRTFTFQPPARTGFAKTEWQVARPFLGGVGGPRTRQAWIQGIAER